MSVCQGRGGGGVSKILFSVLRASVWSKNKGEGGSPGFAAGYIGLETKRASYDVNIKGK